MAFVKIGGLKFKVREVAELYDNDLKLEGDINYNNQTIRIEKKNMQGTKDMVLIHEVMHGLIALGVSRDLGGNEDFILQLSHNLYATMRDNPKLFIDIIQRKV